MVSQRASLFYRKMLVSVPFVFVVILITMFAYGALLARQQGLAPAPAAVKALHQLPAKMLPVFVGCATALAIVLLMYGGRRAQQASPVERGRAMWERMRLWSTVGILPFLLIALATMIYHLIARRWQDADWSFGVLFVICAILLAFQWLHRPSSQHLYVMGTGDESRLNDERAQLVRGRAAQATLGIFTGVLVVGGSLYETVLLGRLPILTGAEFLTLGLIWIVAATRWDRRL